MFSYKVQANDWPWALCQPWGNMILWSAFTGLPGGRVICQVILIWKKILQSFFVKVVVLSCYWLIMSVLCSAGDRTPHMITWRICVGCLIQKDGMSMWTCLPTGKPCHSGSRQSDRRIACMHSFSLDGVSGWVKARECNVVKWGMLPDIWG